VNFFALQRSKHFMLKERVTALDVGSHKITCAIGELHRKDAQVKIIKAVSVASKGIKSHHIVNMDLFEDSVLNALNQCEEKSQNLVQNVFLSVPTLLLKMQHTHLKIAINQNFIHQGHIDQLLIDACRKIRIAGYEVIHVYPFSFRLDDNTFVTDPVGMLGQTLEAHLILVFAPTLWLKNILSCLARCRIQVEGFVCSSFALSLALCLPDEIALGATLIEMGASSTSFSCFLNGRMIEIGAVPIGAYNITMDIARGLCVSLYQAERIKTFYGSLIGPSHDEREHILITQLGEEHSSHVHQISKKTLRMIITARLEEICEQLVKVIQQKQIDPLCLERFILTGGGSALQGMREFFQNSLNVASVRVAHLSHSDGDFATSDGLLRYALFEKDQQRILKVPASSRWHRFKRWISM
jgi:cell division protein FtsA